jgi:hypothetical protein
MIISTSSTPHRTTNSSGSIKPPKSIVIWIIISIVVIRIIILIIITMEFIHFAHLLFPQGSFLRSGSGVFIHGRTMRRGDDGRRRMRRISPRIGYRWNPVPTRRISTRIHHGSR